ncbi:MAG: 4-(cytidine 5'-diphospho)-2-C-methyl-D-erythritol kinase, partial [Ignavibacteria bacterium RIFOXYB2_FULL_36_7]
AKINIGLNVVSKRQDGYHNIETIFYPLNLCDQLTIKEAGSFLFTSNNNELTSTPDNLIVNAKEELEKERGEKINVHIHLDKNIPIGGGLGGGSSDAASTLTGLNKFLELNLDYEKLFNIALSIGSDVPFFLNPKPCFAESRGEKFSYFNLSISNPILIVNPGIYISTKRAYEQIIPTKPEFSLTDIKQEHFDNFNELKEKVKNDFEQVVFSEFLEVEKLKKQIYKSGASFVLMSGSGSTLFGIFKDFAAGWKAKKNFEKDYFTYLQN